jgi:hypothetical protein
MLVRRYNIASQHQQQRYLTKIRQLVVEKLLITAIGTHIYRYFPKNQNTIDLPLFRLLQLAPLL